MWNNIVDELKRQYPHRGIEILGTMVIVDGEIKFNCEGYTLLHNLTRLCEVLKDELK